MNKQMNNSNNQFDNDVNNNLETELFEVEIDEGLHNSKSNNINTESQIQEPNQFDLNNEMEEFKQIKKIQNLALAGSICGAISVIIGGVILSIVALALAIAAFLRIKKLKVSSFDDRLQKKIKISAIVALVISAGALILNFISAVILLPSIMAYLENGDISSLMSSFDIGNSTSTTSRSQTWG